MKKTTLILVTGISALAITGCSTAHPVAARTPAPYSPPPAVTYSAPPPPPPPDNPLQDWWNNTGSADWTQVSNDLQQVQTDASNGDQYSLMGDAGTLRTDALAAAKDHPPWKYDKHAYYFGVMGALAFAAVEMQYGNWTKATSFMQTADGDVTKFEAEAQAEGVTVSTGGF